MRGEAVAGIEAALLVNGFEFGELVAVGLNEGLLVRRDLSLDGDGLIAGRGAVMAERGLKLLEIEVEAAGDDGQIGVDVVVLLANQEAGDGRIVVNEETALAIEELAAGGEDWLLANAVLLGEQAEVLSAEDLHPPQLRGEHEHQDEDAVLHHRCFEWGEFFAALSAEGVHCALLLGYC